MTYAITPICLTDSSIGRGAAAGTHSHSISRLQPRAVARTFADILEASIGGVRDVEQQVKPIKGGREKAGPPEVAVDQVCSYAHSISC